MSAFTEEELQYYGTSELIEIILEFQRLLDNMSEIAKEAIGEVILYSGNTSNADSMDRRLK